MSSCSHSEDFFIICCFTIHICEARTQVFVSLHCYSTAEHRSFTQLGYSMCRSPRLPLPRHLHWETLQTIDSAVHCVPPQPCYRVPLQRINPSSHNFTLIGAVNSESHGPYSLNSLIIPNHLFCSSSKMVPATHLMNQHKSSFWSLSLLPVDFLPAVLFSVNVFTNKMRNYNNVSTVPLKIK